MCCIIFLGNNCYAQETIIKGKVTDASTGEALPFVNIFFVKSHIGVVTDFDGFYILKSAQPDDSVTYRFIGYENKTRKVTKGITQTINIQLAPAGFEMKEIVVKAGENPAHRILRKVWANEQKNDKRSLKAYEYESYAKIELDADNIDEKFKNSKMMKPFRNVFDSLKLIAGEDGKPILPFFISENLSDYYYLSSPERKKEVIKASRIKGVGVNDEGFMSQLMGSSFQDYNFYKNWINILEKNFASPISQGGLGYYKYYLVDSLVIDGKYCYKIEFKPKRDGDLAFKGTMWITDTTFALKRIVAEVGKRANLNYIERIKIQQDLVQTPAGPWIPAKVRILVDVAELTDKSFGILAKLYISNDKIVVNKNRDLGFYEDRITIAEDSQDKEPGFWEENRHEQLTEEDKKVYQLVDTIKKMPRVKTYIDVIDFIVNGYVRAGKVEFGPHILTYGNNIVEGHRFRLGFRTNDKFSKQWILKGYGAYGTKDGKFKYNAQVEHFLSRKSWTKVGIQYKHDVEGLGVEDDFLSNNNLLIAATQLGLLDRMNRVDLGRVWLESDLFRGFNARIYFLHKYGRPVGKLNFGYYLGDNGVSDFKRDYRFSEITLETRYAYKEAQLIKGNNRVHVGIDRAPILTLQYSYGIKGLLGSDFEYHKASFGVGQKIKLGIWGRGQYQVTGTKIFTPLPYPMLNILLGNETPVRNEAGFNMMNFFEFIGDQSVTAHYTQHFDGLFFNRIPLLKRLKLREVAGAKAAWVWFSDKNLKYIPETDPYGASITPIAHMDPSHTPYVEIFYGIENIVKILRIDAIHRITYTNTPGVQKYFGIKNFGLKGSLYFSF